MPELAEVEYYRKRWNAGLGKRIERVSFNAKARVFRDLNLTHLRQAVLGRKLVASETRGKNMLFQFSPVGWLSVHLGMTGTLQVENSRFVPRAHDHLVLYQRNQALIFNDPRQFGRVKGHVGKGPPEWWLKLPPPLTSTEFTMEAVQSFLRAHPRLPIKAALLLQDGFPGIGNWMADEILWRTRLHPQTLGGALNECQLRTLWKTVRFVCRGALRHIGEDFSGPPQGWLVNERWEKTGRCPRHSVILTRATIGGRTTVWCRRCQRSEPR